MEVVLVVAAAVVVVVLVVKVVLGLIHTRVHAAGLILLHAYRYNFVG